jgi:hypothetical protein
VSAASLRRASSALLLLLLCSLSTACGDPEPGLCEAQQLQCSQGYCNDHQSFAGMLPSCDSREELNVSYGFALPAQLEPLVPGRVEGRTTGEFTVRYLGFEAAAGQHYRFQLTQNTGVDARIWLLDASGQRSDAGSRGDASFELLQLHTSQRYVVVLTFEGVRGAPYAYSLELVPGSEG